MPKKTAKKPSKNQGIDITFNFTDANILSILDDESVDPSTRVFSGSTYLSNKNLALYQACCKEVKSARDAAMSSGFGIGNTDDFAVLSANMMKLAQGIMSNLAEELAIVRKYVIQALNS